MTRIVDESRSRPIPSVDEFKSLTPDRKESAFKAAYRALYKKHINPDFAEKRQRLLQEYQRAAGWSNNEAQLLKDAVIAE